jgi:TetR/AcrR family transcriptional repressor of nem operon
MTRYQPEHKQQTRRRLIESAVTAFRRDGVESAGLKQIMQEMGLTVGGFYRHFSSKSQLVQSAVALGLLQSVEQFRKTSGGDGPADARVDSKGIEVVERFAMAYLSEPHRRSIAKGCVLAALGSDIARSDSDVKAVCEAGLREMHAELHRSVSTGSQELRERLWALMALELGGLLLSRMVAGEETAAEILSSCRRTARALLDPESAPRGTRPRRRKRSREKSTKRDATKRRRARDPAGSAG